MYVYIYMCTNMYVLVHIHVYYIYICALLLRFAFSAVFSAQTHTLSLETHVMSVPQNFEVVIPPLPFVFAAAMETFDVRRALF